ncbi:LTA synthase family protein [Thiolapillus brandeum]|uniref:Sulfatase family protein n=1 Tax=Thiolapillus brandeum TaxID=1076588 RepID=A0A7U6JIL1_9GAMM|nr:LTA synthase family protein [Thiolapillus brandeum]BAO45411.1 sulfatase family protein [Thiolapillus brandeum]
MHTTSSRSSTSRFRLVAYLFLTALLYFSLTRIFLATWFYEDTSAGLADLLQIMLRGWTYDLVFYAYLALLPAAYLLLAPEKWWRSRWNALLVHSMVFISIYGLGFIAVAEVLFWDEFSVRFNFIAVDYLVYRREVTDNIAESYPLPLLLGGILVVSILVYAALRPFIRSTLQAREPLPRRAIIFSIWALVAACGFLLLDQDLRRFSGNSYQNELAGNGPYQFFAAFRNNELDYPQFYATIDNEQASGLLKEEIKEDSSRFSKEGLFQIRRHIDNPGQERSLNIMLITVESLSARYLGVFGHRKHYTPNLDKLSRESMFFTNFYATGTRTTRGLEAITLSIPPTPGRSIVKRLGHESNLWSLGNILKEKGYDVRFLYGGRGYFDNMSAFFSGNGYQVIDQSSVPDEDMTFTNAWGMSDEDLYRQAMKSADASWAAGKPFLQQIMTTSNHRPYTYPDNRVDIPSGSGRGGAVKYTDWAIGDFLAQAKNKPWFKDTLFVIVADHCASSAGKVDLPVKKYHIPLFIYAPEHVKPVRIDKMASQIDLAPTLLALLNMDYESAFFGRNILTTPKGKQRALIGNYQKLGLYEPGRLSILAPRKEIILQKHPESDNPQVFVLDRPDDFSKRNIAYYQGASYIYKHGLNAWKQTRTP